MLTPKQLYNKTSKERREKAQYVRIIRVKMGHNRQGLGYIAAKTYSRYIINSEGRVVKNPDRRDYITMLTFLNRKLQCIASCSCGDNTFRWEVANAYKGASEVEFSNGDPPVITNPTFKVGLCKHLVALYLKIKPQLPEGH